VRQQLERSGDAPGFVRVLQRAGSPYAGPLASVLRERGPDLVALETALDRTFAARARAAAQRGGRLLAGWVAEGIDLENSWGVLLGAPGGFLEGGRQLSSAQCDLIQREPDAVARRARLADVFAGGPLARLFGDEDAPPATLERRARDARAAACARAARIEPLGVLALLAVVLRLRDEAARLRRIGWAVAQGVPDPYASGPAWGAS